MLFLHPVAIVAATINKRTFPFIKENILSIVCYNNRTAKLFFFFTGGKHKNYNFYASCGAVCNVEKNLLT
jgi:hypothetical protein